MKKQHMTDPNTENMSDNDILMQEIAAEMRVREVS